MNKWDGRIQRRSGGETTAERKAVADAIESLRKQGATSAATHCPVCGMDCIAPISEALALTFDPCRFCGATYRERKRARNATLN